MTGSLTPASIALLAMAAVAAGADWVVVARDASRPHDAGRPRATPSARLFTKPLVLVLLVAVAITLEPRDPAVRAWFVVGLVCSLVGDVALLSPRGFAAGLAIFLLAHVAYAVGFLVGGVSVVPLVAGLAVMVVFDAVLARRVLPALRTSGRGSLVRPVVAYMAAITAMVTLAAGSALSLAIVGAGLFAASDAILADGRFVRRRPCAEIAVMVLYHVGQACLVLSLVA